MENAFITKIQKEHSKIDDRWLHLHFRTTLGLVIFSLFVETILSIMMCHSEELHTTVKMFIIKYILVPFAINLTVVLVDYFILHSHLSQKFKIYSISLLFVIICFVLFSAHQAFSVLYFIFSIPILLTTIYCDYKLTAVTSFSCIIACITSKLFVKWDADKVSITENIIEFGDFVISIFILLAFFAVCMIVIYFEKQKNEVGFYKEIERYQLKHRLVIDELTGIYNRTAFHEAMKVMEEDDSDTSYIFAMIDVDNFKNINDTHGHVTGDYYLKEFGSILLNNCKDAAPFRYGGDEFSILFRNRSLDETVKICQNILRDLNRLNNCDNSNIKVTASIGIASYSKELSTAMLIRKTDQELYKAKVKKNSISVCWENYNNDMAAVRS